MKLALNRPLGKLAVLVGMVAGGVVRKGPPVRRVTPVPPGRSARQGRPVPQAPKGRQEARATRATSKVTSADLWMPNNVDPALLRYNNSVQYTMKFGSMSLDYAVGTVAVSATIP